MEVNVNVKTHTELLNRFEDLCQLVEKTQLEKWNDSKKQNPETLYNSEAVTQAVKQELGFFISPHNRFSSWLEDQYDLTFSRINDSADELIQHATPEKKEEFQVLCDELKSLKYNRPTELDNTNALRADVISSHIINAGLVGRRD